MTFVRRDLEYSVLDNPKDSIVESISIKLKLKEGDIIVTNLYISPSISLSDLQEKHKIDKLFQNNNTISDDVNKRAVCAKCNSRVVVVSFYVENTTVMIIDAINASLRLFMLIIVEFGLDFVCLWMSLVCFIGRSLDFVGKRCVGCRPLPVVGDDGWSARVAPTVGHFRLSV